MPANTVTREDAEDALNKIWGIFKVEENKQRLMNLVKECDAIDDPQKKILAKMQKFTPAVIDLCGDVMGEYGFGQNDIMRGIIEIQAHAASNPQMQTKVQVIMDAFQGKFPDEDFDEEEEEEAEICD